MSNIIRWFFITVIGILIYFAANLAYMICVLKITTISKIVTLNIPGFILYFYHLLIIIIRASTEPYALGGPAGLIGSLILSYLLLEICDDNISLFKREKFVKCIKLNDEFIDACKNGDIEIVKYLLTSPELKEHADIHANNDQALIWSCSNGHLEVIKYLLTSPELKEHADIHANNDLGFRWACEEGHLEVVKYLLSSPELKEHADIHAKDVRGFIRACEKGRLEVVKFLVFDMDFQLSMETRMKINSLDNKDEIFNLFDKRDFESKLQNNLKVNQEKPVKKTKI